MFWMMDEAGDDMRRRWRSCAGGWLARLWVAVRGPACGRWMRAWSGAKVDGSALHNDVLGYRHCFVYIEW